jgi:hypothetical protein
VQPKTRLWSAIFTDNGNDSRAKARAFVLLGIRSTNGPAASKWHFEW